MIKKIFIFFAIFVISGYISVFAVGEKAAYQNALKDSKTSPEQLKQLKDSYDSSEESEGDITSRGYTIDVNSISPGMGTTGSTTKENVNYLLGTIIQNLMIALGSLALIIMTVGAGYILLHHGQDELLSKGKTIFMSGVYALIIALSSYYLVSIVRYLLYFGDN